jgi:hypothetical protein
MDNDYTREISLLSQQMAAYEDRWVVADASPCPLPSVSTPSSASMPISSLSTLSQNMVVIGFRSALPLAFCKNGSKVTAYS